MPNDVKAVLFDLDNTLLNTDKLCDLRETGLEVEQKHLDMLVLYPKTLYVLNELKARDLILGLITNSPKKYTMKILAQFKLTDFFSTIICYDDVGASGVKPSPNGINMALSKLGLTKDDNVLYIGDHQKDFDAAYAAGVKPIAPSWGSRRNIAQIPAAVMSADSLLLELSSFDEIELFADRCAQHNTIDIPKKGLYFAPLDLEGQVTALDKNKIKIITFGRYFSRKSELTVRYHEKHALSKTIFEKERNPSFVAPQYWVDLFKHFVLKAAEYFLAEGANFDIVTVIPAKQGKNPRLENLLKRLSFELPGHIAAIPDIFIFTPDAKSVKTVGGATARDIEIKRTLSIKHKYIEHIKDKNILVIDDVITTGATLRNAITLLEQQGSGKVIGTCLAKTVSMSEEYKICPECSRLMRLRTNTKTDIRFWGCTGFNDPLTKCKYVEDIKMKDCPQCGEAMVRKKNSRNGEYFLACKSYSTGLCKHTESEK